jgi:hypothetical protein
MAAVEKAAGGVAAELERADELSSTRHLATPVRHAPSHPSPTVDVAVTQTPGEWGTS